MSTFDRFIGSRISRFSLIRSSNTFWTEGTVDKSINLFNSRMCSSLLLIFFFFVVYENKRMVYKQTSQTLLNSCHGKRGSMTFLGFMLYMCLPDCRCIYLYFLVIPYYTPHLKVTAPYEPHFIGLDIPFSFYNESIPWLHINSVCSHGFHVF